MIRPKCSECGREVSTKECVCYEPQRKRIMLYYNCTCFLPENRTVVVNCNEEADENTVLKEYVRIKDDIRFAPLSKIGDFYI